MNPSTDPAPASSPLRGQVLKGCLAVAILALVPHLGKTEDIEDGLRLGYAATTNTASTYALSLGHYNTNPAYWSIALGSGNNMGGSNAGFGSIAAGSSNTLIGYYKWAFGSSNTVSGANSMAIGFTNNLSGGRSLGYGSNVQAASTATNALAGGEQTIAYGKNSVALGYYTTAPSYGSVVLGQYNQSAGGQNTGSWVNSDQLFVIGNGSSGSPSNALEVKKDGTLIIPKRQGDISMGSFTAP